MENNDILIKKHNWKDFSNGWGEYCIYCNSYVGIGTGDFGIGICNERFNYDKFESFLEFHNFSLIDKYAHSKFPNKKTKIYVKRFTNITKTENQLLSEYFKLLNLDKNQIKEIKQIIKNKKS